MRKNLVIAAMVATMAMLGALAALPAGANAQEVRASADVPRAADGHPDLTGVWQGGSNRIGTWEDTNNGEGPLGESGPITPFAVKGPQPKPPYQAWAAAKVVEEYNKRGIDEPMVKCLPPGVPRMTLMGLFPMQIVQTPKTIVMMFEAFHVFRIIPIDAKHPDDLEPTFIVTSFFHPLL